MIIRVSGTLLRYTDFQKEVDVPGETTGTGLRNLVERYPPLKKVLFDREGNLRATHQLFVNGEAVLPKEWDQPVEEDSQIQIITAVSGG